MPPCRQAGTRAGRDAGGRARMPARRQEGVPAIPTAKERDFRRTYVPLPLRGSIWRQCGSLWRSSAPFRPGFTPYLCTQAAGQRSRRVPRPRLRPSFGQPEGIGRPIPSQVGNDRFTPNRRTKQEQSQARLNYVLQGGGRVTLNPSATDFCVLSKVSFELLKGFRVTPETTLPLAGRGFLSEVGKPVFPTCGAVAGSCA